MVRNEGAEKEDGKMLPVGGWESRASVASATTFPDFPRFGRSFNYLGWARMSRGKDGRACAHQAGSDDDMDAP